MKTIKVFLLAATLLTGMAIAQNGAQNGSQAGSQSVQPLTDTDIALLRQDLQSTRMDIVTRNMQLTSAQASSFWPVYREYTNEMQPIGDKQVALIKEYAKNYSTMSDEQAADMTRQLLKISQDELDLKKKFFPRFEKAVGGRTAAKFFQVDNRINTLLNLQLMANIPIIQ